MANGGAVDVSNFRKTGNIRIMHKADFSLLNEVLNIKIEGDYTYVEVNYRLRNNGKKDKIVYGFPVDAFECDWYFGDSEGPNPFSWQNSEIVSSFEAYEDTFRLKTTSWVRDSLYQVQSYNLNENYSLNDKYYVTRKWFILKLDFDSLEEKNIRIKYKVENTKRDKLPGFSYIHRYTDRHFSYHLFPSSKWGDGIVKNMQINIDLLDLKNGNCPYSIEGIENLIETENGFKLSMNDYDLNNSDRINIRYNNSHFKRAEFIEKNKLTKSIIGKVKVSTDKENINNLFDNNPKTFWTGKVGDWIEIEINQIPAKNKYYKSKYLLIGGILILNGNYSSSKDFDNYGHIMYCEIIINDTIKYNTEPWEGKQGKKIIKLKRGEYRDMDNLAGNAIILADNNFLRGRFSLRSKQSNSNTNKIKLKIINVYPSDSGNETFSISELYFVGQ